MTPDPRPAELLHAKPWAAPVLARLRSELARDLLRGVRIPTADEPSGWGHNFTCARCAERLPFDPDAGPPFRCPTCGIDHDDRDRREAWTYSFNLHQILAATNACRFAAWEGDRSALAYARTVLTGYARAYPTYPVHGRWAGKGRLQGQSLCEAVWMLPAVEVFAALRRLDALDDDDLAAVAAMFRAAIALLEPQGGEIHNIHVWLAGAIAALAEAVGDADARTRAEAQLERNLAQGVLPEGTWYECAPHYQFYTAEAFLAYAAAMRALAAEPRFIGRLVALCRMPLRLLLPGGEIAGLNDGWPRNPLTTRAPFYERANALVGGCADALAHCYGVLGAVRDSAEAALLGPAELPEARLALPALDVIDGIAVVRRGGFTVLVKANPDGGGHDHPDKPSLCLHRADATLDAGDLANPGYGNPLHRGWFKTTAAHNTVVVDGGDIARGSGLIRRAEELAPATVIEAEHRGALPGVDLIRTVVVGDGWILDRTVATGATAHRWCWRFHAIADLLGLPDGEAATFLPNPHLTAQRRLAAGPELAAHWRSAAGGELHLRCWRPDDAVFGAARGPALPATKHVDLLLVAATGTRLVVDTLFSLAPIAAERRADTFRIAGLRVSFDHDQRAIVTQA